MEVEIKTVDTILDKGVRVPIPAPLFLRVLGIKQLSVTIRRPVLGNMLRISRMYMRMGVDIDSLGSDFGKWQQVLTTCAVPVSRIVAIGILRGRFRGWLLCRPLAAYLRWKLNSRDMATVAGILVTLSGVQDFLNTIKFVGLMKTTQPTNLSQE